MRTIPFANAFSGRGSRTSMRTISLAKTVPAGSREFRCELSYSPRRFRRGGAKFVANYPIRQQLFQQDVAKFDAIYRNRRHFSNKPSRILMRIIEFANFLSGGGSRTSMRTIPFASAVPAGSREFRCELSHSTTIAGGRAQEEEHTI